MPTYSKGDERKYFPAIIAALVVAAGIIGYLVYAFVLGQDQVNYPTTVVETVNGTEVVNPGGGAVPSYPPPELTPITPQPAN